MLYKKIFIIIGSVALITLVFLLFNGSSTKPDSDKDYKKYFYKNYKIFAVDIPDTIEFAGEKVETNRFDVRESIDRELLVNSYWQSQTLMIIKKANRYFPIIEPVLKKNNVPDDFKYLAVAESNLANSSVSTASAAGLWQFIKATAIEYGLEVNDNIDERYNIEKSTEAACKYLLQSYKTYNNWTLAAASYNMGTAGLNKQTAFQKAGNYYDLYLNPETARYIYRIISLKLILSNPEEYGYYLRKRDKYPPIPTYTVKVDSSITSLVDFAAKYKINYKILKEFNLWLRKPTLDNVSRKTYYLTIPKEGAYYYDSLLSSVKDDPLELTDSIGKAR